jgi:hypothetical protein
MENKTCFNLNTAIENWRRELVALPGLTAEVRRELETHLCDAISEYQKHGRNDEESFQGARQRLGQPQQLVREFKKVGNDSKIMRALLLVIGWLAAGFMLLYGVAGLDFGWSFFGFSPKWSLQSAPEMCMIFVALPSVWFLAMASRDKVSRVVSLLVCVFLAWLAVYFLHADEDKTGIFGGHYDVPLWYRGGRTLLLCVPGVFWVWWTRRHLGQKHGPTNGSQPIHSD